MVGVKATTVKYLRKMTDKPCRGIHFPRVLKTQGTHLPILFWCLPRKYMPLSVNPRDCLMNRNPTPPDCSHLSESNTQQ
jgi:hypothetical protein